VTGRNSKPHKVMRIRYRNPDSRKTKSHLVFSRSKNTRVKGGDVLRTTKVSEEELLRVGEFNPLTQPDSLEKLLNPEPVWAQLSPEEESLLVRGRA